MNLTGSIANIAKNLGYCTARLSYKDNPDIYHVCGKRGNHKFNHKCVHCDLEWSKDEDKDRDT